MKTAKVDDVVIFFVLVNVHGSTLGGGLILKSHKPIPA